MQILFDIGYCLTQTETSGVHSNLTSPEESIAKQKSAFQR